MCFYLQFILAFSIFNHTPVSYADYVYPWWAIAIGWVFALCSMIPLPVVALVMILRSDQPLLDVS